MMFDAMVDAWVADAAPAAADFGDLVRRLPGVYPNDVRDAAQRQGLSLAMAENELLVPTRGPLPHPTDGDWRFSDDASAELASRAAMATNGRVGLLGCPSLAPGLLARGLEVSVVERNQAWRAFLPNGRLRWHCGDVSEIASTWHRAFDVVIADPPWYPLEVERFLRVGADTLADGGVLLLSWPGEGTRPGIAEEWRDLLRICHDVGLVLAERLPLALDYWTPFYEGQALRAAGLPVQRAWRRSDLVEFRLRADGPARSHGPVPSQWRACRVGALSLRVCLTPGARKSTDMRLVSVVSGDVLPTVSSRDPRRRRAAVVTAGNRVFSCRSPELLHAIAGSLSSGNQPTEAVERVLRRAATATERGWVLEAADSLRALGEREAADYHALHGSQLRLD